jgi:hypothetical protein
VSENASNDVILNAKREGSSDFYMREGRRLSLASAGGFRYPLYDVNPKS